MPHPRRACFSPKDSKAMAATLSSRERERSVQGGAQSGGADHFKPPCAGFPVYKQGSTKQGRKERISYDTDPRNAANVPILVRKSSTAMGGGGNCVVIGSGQ